MHESFVLDRLVILPKYEGYMNIFGPDGFRMVFKVGRMLLC